MPLTKAIEPSLVLGLVFRFTIAGVQLSLCVSAGNLGKVY